MALIILQFIGGATVGTGVVLGIRQLLKIKNPIKSYVRKIVTEYLTELSKD